MLVVKRPFRNFGKVMVPGSVVEPATVKRYRSKLKDGSLIEVTEQDFNKWNDYFIVKFHTPIGPLVDTTREPAGEPVQAKPATLEPVKSVTKAAAPAKAVKAVSSK